MKIINLPVDSNSFHAPNPKAAKALLSPICEHFLLFSIGSTLGIFVPMVLMRVKTKRCQTKLRHNILQNEKGQDLRFFFTREPLFIFTEKIY